MARRQRKEPQEQATGVTRGIGLTDAQLTEIYRRMYLSRSLDLRAWTLSRQGKAHFVITSRGHEALQVATAFTLRPGHDWICPYYRDLALVVGLGITARETMLNIFGRADDPYGGGRQLPMHFSSPALRILSGSSVVATQVPHAVGIAMAERLKGSDSVVLACFGEGTSSKGDVHEALNWAGVQRLPVVFLCENNGYAISTAQRYQMAASQVADRAAGYGMPGVTVDGNDPLAVYQAMTVAVDRARRRDGPSLVEAMTYRLTPHSSDDDDRKYRSREEVAAAQERDPIIVFRRRLVDDGIASVEALGSLESEVAAEIDDAVAFAEASPPPLPEDALSHVYAE
jgi:2-oxoisovalerate dehydrogenase E1 component alpha subunit